MNLVGYDTLTMTSGIARPPHARLPPALRNKAQKLLDSGAFVADLCQVFERYRSAYAAASEYDLLAAKRGKKTAKAVIKLTKKLLEFKNELASRLVAGNASHAGKMFAHTAEFERYVTRLQPLMTADFDQAAHLFCNATESAFAPCRKMPATR